MSTAAPDRQANPAAPEPGEARLRDAFFEALAEANPFSRDRISEPSARDVDVPSIHGESFEELTRLARQPLRNRTGIGVALFGTAGIGKSHLLARLYRWADEREADGSPRAHFTFVHNLMADPDRLPRYLLKCVVAGLASTRSHPGHPSPLFRLLHEALWTYFRREKIQRPSYEHADVALEECFENASLQIPQPIRNALIQFYRFAKPVEPGSTTNHRNRELARAAQDFLSGEEIDERDARDLLLRVSESSPPILRDDADVQALLVALGLLAARDNRPFILCVDQVDNLDRDKLTALTRFLHSLIDHAANLLVVFSGVESGIEAARQESLIPQAAWNRIAQHRIDLQPIRPHDARHLLEARIERSLEPYHDLEGIAPHLSDDTLFPLGRDWFEQTFGELIELWPRYVLIHAREQWDRHARAVRRHGGTKWLESWPELLDKPAPPPATTLTGAIDSLIDNKITELIAQRQLNPDGLPPDAGNLVGLVEFLLRHCLDADLGYSLVGLSRPPKHGGRMSAYNLHIDERRDGDGARVSTALACVTNPGRSATESLKRLLMTDRVAAGDHRLLVTEPGRAPLRLGAIGEEVYLQLKKLGPDRFHSIKLTFEDYAALDALAGVVGLARSGDLDLDWPAGASRRIDEAEVIASHHRQDRYRAHPLLKPLLTEEYPAPPDPSGQQPKLPPPGPLDDDDLRTYVLGQIGWRTGMSGHELIAGYLRILPPAPTPGRDPAECHAQLKRLVTAMHGDGRLHAEPVGDDLLITRNH